MKINVFFFLVGVKLNGTTFYKNKLSYNCLVFTRPLLYLKLCNGKPTKIFMVEWYLSEMNALKNVKHLDLTFNFYSLQTPEQNCFTNKYVTLF